MGPRTQQPSALKVAADDYSKRESRRLMPDHYGRTWNQSSRITVRSVLVPSRM